MKDLIAKLQSDACVAMGAIWLHIEAREKRIAELEAENTKLRAALAATAAPVLSDALEAMDRAKLLPIWDNDVPHKLHVELDVIFKALAALASQADALVAGDRVDAVKCWKDRMASPQNREWRGAMEEAMEAEIMELRMVLSSNKVDAERYRYIRDTATLDNAVWEALEGYGMTNGAGELLEDEYRAGMDRAIDRAIQAQKDGHG